MSERGLSAAGLRQLRAYVRESRARAEQARGELLGSGAVSERLWELKVQARTYRDLEEMLDALHRTDERPRLGATSAQSSLGEPSSVWTIAALSSRPLCDYLRAGYPNDIAVLRERLNRSERHLELCDCAIQRLHDALQDERMVDGRRLAIALFLEATLLAGVHCYLPQCFVAYRDSLASSLKLVAHHIGGVRAPQRLLESFEWPTQQLALLGAACTEGLRMWAAAFDGASGSGEAARLFGALAMDGHLAVSRALPAAVTDTYRRAFLDVAQAVGGRVPSAERNRD